MKFFLKCDDLFDKHNDIFNNFRGMLVLGRVLGLLPLSGISRYPLNRVEFRIFSIAGLTSIVCIMFAACASTLGIVSLPLFGVRKYSTIDVVNYARLPIFASWGLFLYVHFFMHRCNFMKIFKSWEKCSSNLVYTRKDTNLKFTTVLICIVVFSSTVLENMLLHLQFIPQLDHINSYDAKHGKETVTNDSSVQIFCHRGYKTKETWESWDQPIFCLVAFIGHKLIWYSINYSEVLMALLGRALYFQFQALNRMATDILLSDRLESSDMHVSTTAHYQSQQSWNQLVKDHDLLCFVLETVNNFFSPVVYVSYTMNLFFLCTHLVDKLNPYVGGETVIISIYSFWSFIHIIVRVFLNSLFWARVNEHAHKTRDIVMQCPSQFKNDPVTRLDKRVNGEPKLGLSGLGCFIVTKPFMLSFLNVIFTFGIFLLQSLTASNESKLIQQN